MSSYDIMIIPPMPPVELWRDEVVLVMAKIFGHSVFILGGMPPDSDDDQTMTEGGGQTGRNELK